jgi:hypothetical protein
MTNKQILYLHIFSKKEGYKKFDVSSRFDIYVLQNKENMKPTEVVDEVGKKHLLKINEMPFLPNYAYEEINKIITTQENGINVIYNTSYHSDKKDKVSSKKTQYFKYPIVHTINKDGVNYWYSNENKEHFGEPKVILNKNEKQYSYKEQNDYEGKYGMSELSFGIPIKSKKEGDLILKAIETPEFKKIIESTKWSAFHTDYRMFKYFKPDFYKYFL